MDENVLKIFGRSDTPTYDSVWSLYDKSLRFNDSIELNETVKVNENFLIGKQWEGVQSNGLPTPIFNILKRVVGFTVATITTDNLKINAIALDNTPNTSRLFEPVRIVNEEFEALTEINDITALIREQARNAAVDGDGCLYTYWDADVDMGGGIKGAIKTEPIINTRVHFGNPNDRHVQSQPYIIIARREIVRKARKRAKANGSSDWSRIVSDNENEEHVDNQKKTDDKVTVLLTMWRDEKSGEIYAYESTENCEVKKPWSLGIRLYPVTWINWDYVQDCYHGQAMITGLIPNQIFINKAWAMSMLSMMRTSFPKVIYDKSRIRNWDNRVGGAIGVPGNIENVAKIIDPAAISPQISQFIQLAVEQTEQSLGATSVALGDTRPDNTSAIIALQKAASTPSEMTKQNLYKSCEELYRIYFEFMAEYYGVRNVDMETPEEIRSMMMWAGKPVQDEIVQEFDFGVLKDIPMSLKIDVGASSYYSQIAAQQTLDNLLINKFISPVQYLERTPGENVPKLRSLINELKQQAAQQNIPGMMQNMMPETLENAGTGISKSSQNPKLAGGSGYGSLQRQINRTGNTKGLI